MPHGFSAASGGELVFLLFEPDVLNGWRKRPLARWETSPGAGGCWLVLATSGATDPSLESVRACVSRAFESVS